MYKLFTYQVIWQKKKVIKSNAISSIRKETKAHTLALSFKRLRPTKYL